MACVHAVCESGSSAAPQGRRISLRKLLLAPLGLALVTLLSFIHRPPHLERGAPPAVRAPRVCNPQFQRHGGSETVNDRGLGATHTHPWPGGRSGSAVWGTSSGFYIFGGMGYGSNRNDAKGKSSPAGRGASSRQSTTHLADAWRWSARTGEQLPKRGTEFSYVGGPAESSDTQAAMGTLGTYSGSMAWPGGRDVPMVFTDYLPSTDASLEAVADTKDRLLLFGGWGYGAGEINRIAGSLGDLWQMDVAVATGSQGSRAKAQYLGGPTETNAPGQRKHPNAWPGARYGGASFSVRIPKAGGAMFLFGGQGYGLAGTGSGTNIVGADGSSTTGIPESFRAAENSATKNTAHNRAGSDGKGKEPGQGLVYGDLNDLWLLRPVMAAGPGTKFQDSASRNSYEWQMLGGSGGTNALGRYPPQSEVWPGARSASACWSMVKSSGASVDGHSDEATAVPVLFIFGGWGFDRERDNRLNDLWSIFPGWLPHQHSTTAEYLGGRQSGSEGSVYIANAGAKAWPGFGLGEAGTASETSVGRLADLWELRPHAENGGQQFHYLGGPRELNAASTESWPGARSYLTAALVPSSVFASARDHPGSEEKQHSAAFNQAHSGEWLLFGGRGIAKMERRDGRLNELWSFSC